ncbi:MAG: thioredoxin [Deltaproteobacteria bacterium]|nr:MAG: thioredoxin [Deltaproteobacteria bacterium]
MSAYRDLTTVEEVEDLMAEDAGPVVFDFWSSTCGPCRAMAPHFAQVAADFEGSGVVFAKIQTDRHPELAAPFHIRAVPTLVFAHRGEVLDAVVGAMPAPALARKVRWLLDKAEGKGFWARLFG